MMDAEKQTEALRLAAIPSDYSGFNIIETQQAQAALLRQDARIAELEAENASLREQRQPLTAYQVRDIIVKLNQEFHEDEGWNYGDFATAIERAHKIGGGNAD